MTAIPYRGTTSSSTYFVTAGTYNKANLLQSDRMADVADAVHAVGRGGDGVGD